MWKAYSSLALSRREMTQKTASCMWGASQVPDKTATGIIFRETRRTPRRVQRRSIRKIAETSMASMVMIDRPPSRLKSRCGPVRGDGTEASYRRRPRCAAGAASGWLHLDRRR